MIIIHAAQLDGNLTMWGEDSDPAPQSYQGLYGRHPRCASAQLLVEAMDITPQDSASTEVEATIWLPSRGNNPLPSEALARPAPKSMDTLRIKPCRVPALYLSTETTMLI